VDKREPNKAKIFFTGFNQLQSIRQTKNAYDCEKKTHRHKLEIFTTDNFDKTTLFFDDLSTLEKWQCSLKEIINERDEWKRVGDEESRDWRRVRKL